MQGFLLQRLSSRRLLAVLVVCCVLTVVFFVVGEAIYPNYDRTQSDEKVLTICDGQDDRRVYDSKACRPFPNNTRNGSWFQEVAVHMLKLPVKSRSFTPWNQFIIISLQMELGVDNTSVLTTAAVKDTLQFEVTIESTFFRKNFGAIEWSLFSGIKQTRSSFSCRLLEDKKTMQCNPTAYFELNSINRDFYLLNIRISARVKNNATIKLFVKQLKAKVTSLREKFTKSFLAIKLLFFPLSLVAMLWHINKVKKFDQDETSFHAKQMIALAISIVFLNLPIEWLTLWVSLPPVQLLYDIRLVIFYAALFYFAVGFLRYFAEERPRRFRINLFCIEKKFYTVDVAVPIICFSLVVYYTWYRVSILGNFFYSYEVSQSSQRAILAYVATVGVLAFLFSFYQILPVVWSIPALKREPKYSTRVTYYIAMTTTVAVLLLTTLYFLIADLQGVLLVYDRGFKISGALYTGIYGVWNIYVIVLLYLFAPVKLPEFDVEFVEDVDIVDAGIKVSEDPVK